MILELNGKVDAQLAHIDELEKKIRDDEMQRRKLHNTIQVTILSLLHNVLVFN
jgi:hypothetical protein